MTPGGGSKAVCVVADGVANPRPAGVWLVTRPAGGGGGAKALLRSPKLLDRFPNFKISGLGDIGE